MVSLLSWLLLELESIKELSKLNTLSVEKRQYLLYFWSDKGFKGTVGNLTLSSLHGLKLRLQSLKRIFFVKNFKNYINVDPSEIPLVFHRIEAASPKEAIEERFKYFKNLINTNYMYVYYSATYISIFINRSFIALQIILIFTRYPE